MTALKMAHRNIFRRSARSLCIAGIIALTTLLIAGGTYFSLSLRNGVKSVSARLGADAMVVPRSADESYEGALLSGTPSSFYMTAEAAGRIAQIDSVARATAQLFISTFDSSHCAALVQIIGYDPETDFVVAPWLSGSGVRAPGDGEVLLGAGLRDMNPGDDFQVFALYLKVSGKLDKTGMGFDNSVFVNFHTAQILLGEYQRFTGAIPLPQGETAKSVVSAVLVDLKPEASLTKFQYKVNTEFRSDDVRVILSGEILARTSENLGLMTGVLTVLSTALWIFSALVFAVIFSLVLNERRREFGLLRAVGAARGKLARIVLTEAALLSAIGAISGAALLCLIIFPYQELFERAFKAAFLPPNGAVSAVVIILSCVLGTLIGPLSALFSVTKITRTDVFESVKEGW